MTTAKLLKKVTQLKELKNQEAGLHEQITAIEDELKAEMLKQEKQEIKVGLFTIRYTDVTAKRFDTSTFKQKYMDLYNQFLKVSCSKRFSIS